ncbi:hypothetical protein [Sutterella wadsworthensis]|nr:hypothetical protein [Sutterella wadsworthensis]MBT9622977.1 hypothetical protein [Sutterella wadsworthensis]
MEIESGIRCDSTECQHVCRGVAAKTVGAVSGAEVNANYRWNIGLRTFF